MYKIQTAARRAGVSTQLLRVWERRYGLVRPQRTPSGYRIYSEDDVSVLRGAKRLVDAGLSIAEVCRLPRERLYEAALAPAKNVVPDVGGPALVPARNAGWGASEEALLSVRDLATDARGKAVFLESAIAAIGALDVEALEKVLYRAMGMGALSAREICNHVLLPLLQEIGLRWERGELSVGAEHFGSAVVRAKLLHLVASEARRVPGAPAVVCACIEGEEHEGALLAFAVHAAGLGLRVIYLGANTPIEDVLAAARLRRARYLALSMTRTLAADERASLIARLVAWRDEGPRRVVVLGGRGASTEREAFTAAGLHVADRATDPLLFSEK